MKNHEKIPDQALLSPQIDPRLIIYKEIQTYRSKLSEYQQLQKQLNELNLHLDANQPQQNDTSKLNKSKNQKGRAIGNGTKRNSHKKIKIYQLQKKHDRAARENEEKRINFQRNMEIHNKFLWQIEELSSKIEGQKKTTQNLKQLSSQIQSDLEVTSSKIQNQVIQLEKSVKQKETCNYQRKKIREDIKRTRTLIHNITNNLTEDLQLSYSDEDQRIIPKSDTSLPYAGVPIPQLVTHATDLQIWMERQTKRIQDMLMRYDSSHQKNEGYLHDFYRMKKEMISNQLVVKHHKVTIALQASKVKQYEGLVHKFRENINRNSMITHEITSKINKLDGQRGYMRGSIGVKIEQQRLARAVNALLEEEVRKLRGKMVYLNFIKDLVEQRTS